VNGGSPNLRSNPARRFQSARLTQPRGSGPVPPRPGDLVSAEDDAGRHCFRVGELPKAELPEEILRAVGAAGRGEAYGTMAVGGQRAGGDALAAWAEGLAGRDDAVKGFLPGPDPNAQRFYSSDSLIVDVASPRYLLAMKLFAARAEGIPSRRRFPPGTAAPPPSRPPPHGTHPPAASSARTWR
jgi:hypothetical protein